MLRTFAFSFAWRIAALTLLLGLMCYWAVTDHQPLQWVLPGMGALFMAFSLFRYVNDINRRLTRFFESVRYSDFAVRFSSSKEKGDSFEEVNRQFNEVMEAFRQTRAEKEANLLFMNALVQHLTTGVLAFDAQQNLLISNNVALQLLGTYRIQRLSDLPAQHQALISFIKELDGRGKMLYRSDPQRQLAVQGVQLNLQGRSVRLLTLQNIQSELQDKETDAWRDLTRVLRHEIMNSITPILSLVETMQDIVRYDLPSGTTGSEDLREALDVVAARSRGLVDFVDAYRTFTALPLPRKADMPVKRLLERTLQLALASQKEGIPASSPPAEGALPSATGERKLLHLLQTDIQVDPPDLTLHADPAQIEMVLLNLLKNACEALESQRTLSAPRIVLSAGTDTKNHPYISVTDNGPGISPELFDEIFIPFFTTKPFGTGVGLSLSRQIMHQHGGTLRVSSRPGETVFQMIF